MRDNLVLLCYVDDCLILCKDEAKIMASFISNGVQLIPRVINSIGLKDSRLHDTPAEPGKPLTKDVDGPHCMYHWSF